MAGVAALSPFTVRIVRERLARGMSAVQVAEDLGYDLDVVRAVDPSVSHVPVLKGVKVSNVVPLRPAPKMERPPNVKAMIAAAIRRTGVHKSLICSADKSPAAMRARAAILIALRGVTPHACKAMQLSLDAARTAYRNGVKLFHDDSDFRELVYRLNQVRINCSKESG
jgi:hypothetical protein